MKKKNLSITNIGTVSLMMIFIVLCMVLFASLSLATAANDVRMGEKTAERLTAYYTASNHAEELLGLTDDACKKAASKASNTEEYYRMIRKELLIGEVEVHQKMDSLQAAFQVDINDSQALQVLLDICGLSQNPSSYYRILSWKVINTQDRETNDTMQLIPHHALP